MSPFVEALAAISALVVTGTTACPSAADVTKALGTLLPSGEARGVGSTEETYAALIEKGTAIEARVLDEKGRLLSEGLIEVEGSCESRADTVAVVLAAWNARLRANVSLPFEAPASDRTATQVATQQWHASLGVEAHAAHQASLAPGGGLVASLRREGGGGARGWLYGTGAHEKTLSPGHVTWRRLALSLGAFRRWRAGERAFFEAGADLRGALLFFEGAGFTEVRSHRAWDCGGGVSARVGVGLGRFEPWVGLDVAAWLRPQIIEVTGLSGQARLPHAELSLGVGLTLRLTE